jgi:hypothetical protein
MSNENNVLFSDVQAARILTHKLRGNAASTTQPTVKLEYVSFGHRESSAPAEQPDFSRPLPPPPPPLPPPLPPLPQGTSAWGEGAWQQRLEWILVAAKAKCAVVLDRQGLVIATRGDISPEIAQSWGGRLLLMLDQAAHIDDRQVRCVCLEFDDEWLTGITGTGPDHPDVAIAVLAEQPVADTIRSAFSTLFNE